MIGKESGNTNGSIEKYRKMVLKKLNLQYLVVIRWEKWVSLIGKSGKVFHIPTYVKQVFDVVGSKMFIICIFLV